MTMVDRRRKGLMLVLSSPSGAGKSSLARELVEADPEMALSVSMTTRYPRQGEVNGREYFFVSDHRFANEVAAGSILEHAVVFGHKYGTPRGPVEDALNAGRDVVFDVDWQGCAQLRASPLGRHVVAVFILPPSIGELEQRLISRGQDSPENVSGRMDRAMEEIGHFREYDYVLINEDFRKCADTIRGIVAVERDRSARRPDIAAFVENLSAEFEDRGGAESP